MHFCVRVRSEQTAVTQVTIVLLAVNIYAMPYRSNAAEAWYPEPNSSALQEETSIDLLPPASLGEPLWKSLLGNLRVTFAPVKLPPLHLVSRPIDLGVPLAERLQSPWYRTVFTNLGEVISPESLPPLELESAPADVGELVSDQLSHFWFGSLLRNLADRLVPERLPKLELTAKPIDNIVPTSWLLLPSWSEVISTPKVFYPDKPNVSVPSLVIPRPISAAIPTAPGLVPRNQTADGLLRELRWSRIRNYVWIGTAAAQGIYLIVVMFWPT
jgi:hypothetical protein